MNQSATTVVLSDQVNPSIEKTEAITAFMFELMAAAEQRGDIEVGMNALLGAYMNLAQKSRTLSVQKSAAALVSAGKAMAAADELLQSRAPTGGEEAVTDAQNGGRNLLAATSALVGKLNAHLPGERHEVVLSALITLFRMAALQFTCCTESSGHHCIAVGQELLASAATGQREPGTPVH